MDYRNIIEFVSIGLGLIILLDDILRKRGEWDLFLSIFLYSYIVEYIGINFAKLYEYPTIYKVMLWGVPIMIPISWAGIIYSAKMIVRKIDFIKIRSQQYLIALVALGIDLLMDPVAVKIGLWNWKEASTYSWFGVTFFNFIGWFFITLVIIEVYQFFQRILNHKILTLIVTPLVSLIFLFLITSIIRIPYILLLKLPNGAIYAGVYQEFVFWLILIASGISLLLNWNGFAVGFDDPIWVEIIYLWLFFLTFPVIYFWKGLFSEMPKLLIPMAFILWFWIYLQLILLFGLQPPRKYL